MPHMNVESFNLDHRAVAAPFIRVADVKHLPHGDVLTKYDIRFCQPNRDHLEMPAVHSIEHSFAEYARNHSDAVVDFSPMGCQTGFYALTLGLEFNDFADILERTFTDLLAADSVPAANKFQCGWGANHSLEGAKREVKKFLAGRDQWHIVQADPDATGQGEDGENSEDGENGHA